MKFLLTSLVLLLGFSTFAGRDLHLRTIDGDTLEHEGRRLRLACVDAPETDQAHGNTATEFLRQRRITNYSIRNIDRYGRQVVIAYERDTPVQALLLQQGLAWFTPSFRSSCPEYANFFQQMELDARLARRGLWADPNPIPPWEHRR